MGRRSRVAWADLHERVDVDVDDDGDAVLHVGVVRALDGDE